MNMRKIIAVLAAVLMLCAVVPMGALSVTAAPGDVAFEATFDTGTDGFVCDGGIPTSADGGYLTFNATCADWANAYAYASGIKADTLYKVTFSAKADKDCVLQFKINNGWAGTLIQNDVNITTEWTNYEFEINTAGLTEGAIITLQSGYLAADGAIYNIDNLKIVEILDPATIGKIVNGDFETGEANGWNLPQQGGVSADAAHDGSYGVNIKGSGSWGGMLDQTIPVEAGQAYEITFWAKVNNHGFNFQIKDGDTSGANIASSWVKATEWTQYSFVVVPSQDLLTINCCGGGDGEGFEEDAYLDSFTCVETIVKAWTADFNDGDKKFSNGEVVAEGPDGSNCYKWSANGGWSATYIVVPNMDPSKDYSVTMKVKASVAGNMGVTIQNGDWGSYWNAPSFAVTTEWQDVIYHIPANSIAFTAGSILFKFQDVGVAMDLYVDDMSIVEGLVEPSNYLDNGDFENGTIAPWNNLWGSCPTAEVIEGGKDSNYALNIVSGLWKHVRQTDIAVKSNTWYKVTAWAKNAAGMSLLIKDGSDSKDIVNAGVEAGDEWTEFTAEFNSGDYNTIIFSLMGNSEEAYGIFDNIVLEKAPCQHNYQLSGGDFATCTTDGTAIYSCAKCGDSYEETVTAYHNGNMEYNPAKEAIDCANPGNIENYYCPGCNEYFADANATEIINPWYIQITVDCVKPEGLADCAGWTCETCGNENFGSAAHDVVVCQGGICSKCNAEIEGYGCSNSTTPACQDGVCDYCGGFVAGFGHENGAWAPCLDGECIYSCGLTYPATEDHVDADGDDYCDTCYDHLAHVDEDGNGECDICWSPMPVVDIVYGDANGDGNISILDVIMLQQSIAGYEVTLNGAAADANGDGNVSILDVIMLQQSIAGYDVTLGPQ